MRAPRARMPIACKKKKEKRKKNTTQRARFSIAAAARAILCIPFTLLFLSPSFTLLFFARRHTAPETPAVGGETFFHGRGCAPTCGMRHGPSVESFLMTGKTTDRTWTRIGSWRRAIVCIFRISFLFALIINQFAKLFISLHSSRLSPREFLMSLSTTGTLIDNNC